MQAFRFKPLIALAALAALATAGTVHAAADIGEPAPGFTLTDTSGETHALSDFEGRTVVLEWTNHQCPFVQKHYGADNMQEQQRTARDEHDAVWLTVISSAPGKQGHVSPEKADALTAERNAEPAAVLFDESGDVGRAYGARTTPHMYIIDADGTLLYKGGIDSIQSADPADIPKADQYVVTALNEMAAGDAISEPVTRPYGCSIKY